MWTFLSVAIGVCGNKWVSQKRIFQIAQVASYNNQYDLQWKNHSAGLVQSLEGCLFFLRPGLLFLNLSLRLQWGLCTFWPCIFLLLLHSYSIWWLYQKLNVMTMTKVMMRWKWYFLRNMQKDWLLEDKYGLRWKDERDKGEILEDLISTECFEWIWGSNRRSLTLM